MSLKDRLRQHWRFTKSVPVQIILTDGWGVDKFINGRTVDISEAGVRIEVPTPIDKGSSVTLCSKQGLQGRASVTSCIRKGMKYLVGLEFADEQQHAEGEALV
jgi:PilZ domain-containing protein